MDVLPFLGFAMRTRPRAFAFAGLAGGALFSAAAAAAIGSELANGFVAEGFFLEGASHLAMQVFASFTPRRWQDNWHMGRCSGARPPTPGKSDATATSTANIFAAMAARCVFVWDCLFFLTVWG